MRRSWTETRGLLALVAAVAAYGLVTPGTALAQQETAPEATVLVDEPSGGRWLRQDLDSYVFPEGFGVPLSRPLSSSTSPHPVATRSTPP